MPFLFAAAEARPELVTADDGGCARPSARLGRGRRRSSPRPGHGLGRRPRRRRATTFRRATRPSRRKSATTRWRRRSSPAGARGCRAPLLIDDFAGTGIGAPGGDDATKALLHILEDIDSTNRALRRPHQGSQRREHAVGRQRHARSARRATRSCSRALADGLDLPRRDLREHRRRAHGSGARSTRCASSTSSDRAGYRIFDLGNLPRAGRSLHRQPRRLQPQRQLRRQLRLLRAARRSASSPSSIRPASAR